MSRDTVIAAAPPSTRWLTSVQKGTLSRISPEADLCDPHSTTPRSHFMAGLGVVSVSRLLATDTQMWAAFPSFLMRALFSAVRKSEDHDFALLSF